MNAYVMTREQIALYGNALRLEERCEATAQKYVGAVTAFFEFLPENKAVSRLCGVQLYAAGCEFLHP